MKEYWEKRFKKEPMLWGVEPSISAIHACELFSKENVKSILIPGSGYGRNSKFFSSAGFNVSAIEISEAAHNKALEFDTKTDSINCSILDIEPNGKFYDAIFCFNILHLFLEKERKIIVDKISSLLNSNGFIYNVVCSEKDIGFGKGKMIELNTFESKPNRPVHYFTHRDLKDHFNSFHIIDSGTIDEEENHGDIGPHTHHLRFIFGQKTE